MKACRVWAARLAVLLAGFLSAGPVHADLSALFTEKTQPSSEFLGLLTQIRDVLSNSGAAQNAQRCAEGAMAEARLAIPRTLSSGVSTADSTSANEYFTRNVSAEGLTGNQCNVNFTANWIKGVKGGSAGNAGIIRVLVTMVCPCTAGPGALKSATLSFSVPVNGTVALDGTMKYNIGAASKFIVEAECCNGRKEPKSQVSLDGALIGVIRDPQPVKSSPAQPPRTPTQPYSYPQTSPPPAKPAPPPPPPTNWTLENPCPECQYILPHLQRARQAVEDAQKQMVEYTRLQEENKAKQDEAKAKITQLQRELGRQQGTGGSAYDPDTGNTTDAWTQADGSVKITVRGPDGKIIEQRTRPSRASTKIKEDIAAQEARLKALEAEYAQLDQEWMYALKLENKHKKMVEDLLKLLQDCIDEKCNKPQGFGCYFPERKSIVIGPKEKFGPDSAASSVASGVMGSVLGGLTKGMIGGGGSDAGGTGPELKTDPVKDKQIFTDPVTGTKVAIGSIIKDGRLLSSVKVEDAKEGEPVIHQMYRERLVPTIPLYADEAPPASDTKDLKIKGYVRVETKPTCKVETQEPIGWEPYGIYEAWWAKLRIQVWQSTDGGPWVQTKDTGWMDWGSGVNLLDSNVMTAEDIPKTAWGSMGGQRPVGAPRAAGAGYEWTGKYVYPGMPAPERMVLHLAQPWKDPVSTSPMYFYPTYGADGTVKYTDKAPDFKWEYKPKPPPIDPKELRDLKPMKPGGGMQQIDPPAPRGDLPEESILDSIEYKTIPIS